MMKIAMTQIAAALAIAAMTTAAVSGALIDAATKAEQLLADGKMAAAVAVLDDAIADTTQGGPLAISQAFFVATRPAGFGAYERRENAFKVDEEMLVYVEPVGFGYTKDGDVFAVELVADVAVHKSDGSLLGGQEKFGTFGLRSLVRNREFFAVITYNFTGLPPGDYVIKTTMKDNATGQAAAFDLPVKITQ